VPRPRVIRYNRSHWFQRGCKGCRGRESCFRGVKWYWRQGGGESCRGTECFQCRRSGDHGAQLNVPIMHRLHKRALPSEPSTKSGSSADVRLQICEHMAFAAYPPFNGTLQRYYKLSANFRCASHFALNCSPSGRRTAHTTYPTQSR